MNYYGTPYFPSIQEARRYYSAQFEGGNVRTKINEGEIHIGKPPTKAGEVAYLVNERPGKRYYIRKTIKG